MCSHFFVLLKSFSLLLWLLLWNYQYLPRLDKVRIWTDLCFVLRIVVNDAPFIHVTVIGDSDLRQPVARLNYVDSLAGAGFIGVRHIRTFWCPGSKQHRRCKRDKMRKQMFL